MTRAADLAKLIAGGGTITVSDNSTNITLKSTDDDAAGGPVFDLTRDSASPADNDTMGSIRFRSDDDGGNETQFVDVTGYAPDVSNGSEDGQLQIRTIVGGTLRNRLDLASGETVFNEDSVDVDFRVESDANTHALFLEGSTGNIGIGTSSPPSYGSTFTVLQANNTASGIVQANNSTNSVTTEIESEGTRGAVGTRTNHAFVIKTNQTERIRILSGGGLTFNGDTATANALDDYEEGDFTPGLKFGGGTTGIGYNTQIGRYTKIGRFVQVNITIYLSSKGSSTGVATITGLPFATAGTQFSAHSYDDRVSGGAVKIQLYNNGNSTQLQLFEADDDQVNNSQIQQDSFSNTAFLIISMQYYVD